MNDVELKELSAEIYYKYKEVLDLIIENRPDVLSLRDKLIECLTSLAHNQKIIFDERYCSKNILRFRTMQLDDFLNVDVTSKKSEWSVGTPYFYEITYSNFQVDFYLSIYSKQQTDTQAKKLFLLTNDRYSKWGFNVSNKFLNRDFSEENLLQEPAKDNSQFEKICIRKPSKHR